MFILIFQPQFTKRRRQKGKRDKTEKNKIFEKFSLTFTQYLLEHNFYFIFFFFFILFIVCDAQIKIITF